MAEFTGPDAVEVGEADNVVQAPTMKLERSAVLDHHVEVVGSICSSRP